MIRRNVQRKKISQVINKIKWLAKTNEMGKGIRNEESKEENYEKVRKKTKEKKVKGNGENECAQVGKKYENNKGKKKKDEEREKTCL